jgi:hypothetical protein
LKSIEELKLKEYKRLFFQENDLNDLSYQFLKENFLNDIFNLYEKDRSHLDLNSFVSQKLREALFHFNQENNIYVKMNMVTFNSYPDDAESSFKYYYFNIHEIERIVSELIERYENDQ